MPGATSYQRPSWFARTANQLIGWLVARGLGPAKTVLLEVEGRRSGRLRRTAVNWVEYQGQRYLVSPRGQTDWVRNVRASGGRAHLRRGKRREARLEEVPPEGRAHIIQKYLRENALTTRRYFGIGPEAALAEFEAIAPRHPVFRITYL
jgi:deazaflavin-dependent oxidoreductase (nitroreductase family)